jgi:hypothetical protein
MAAEPLQKALAGDDCYGRAAIWDEGHAAGSDPSSDHHTVPLN